MIREAFIASAIAAATITTAPAALADATHYDTDVPGMNYDASVGAPCFSWDRFIFGRGPDGEAQACHFVTGNFDPAPVTGYWQISYPLYGVQQIGTPCPNPRGSAAQSPDGLALYCTVSQGWQPGP